MRPGTILLFLKNYLKIYLNKSKRDNKSLIITSLSILMIFVSIILSTLLVIFIDKASIEIELITKALFSYITGLYLVFIFLPITGLSMRGEDPSILLKYPITYLEAFIIETIRSMTNTWALAVFFFPSIALLWIISSSIHMFIVGVIGFLLFYFHAAGIGYIFFSILQGFFEDRRFRDIIAIIAGGFGILVYVLVYFLPELVDLNTILNISYGTHQYLPSGWVVSIVGKNNIYLITLLVSISIITLLLGKLSFKFSYYISIERSTDKQIKNRDLIKLPLDKSINAIINKDFKYYFRDTNQKISLISSMVFILIFGLQPFLQSGTMDQFNLKYLGAFAGFFFPFSYLNYLGYERNGIYKLLSSPVKRRYIILGKNTLLFLVFFTYILALNLAMMILTKTNLSLNYLLISMSTFLLVISVANYIGIRFPQKMPDSLRGGSSSNLMGVLLGFLGTGVLVIPIIIHLLTEAFSLNLKLPIIAIFIYSIICYIIGTRYSIKYLEKNEIKILEKFHEKP